MNACRSATLILVVLLSTTQKAAAETVCPVCGEVWDDDVTVCPNDGSDLSLVGRTPPEQEDDEDLAGKEGNDHKENDASSSKKPTEDSPKKRESRIRYKRHDDGGERRIAPSKERSGFSDRESRLLGSDRTPTASRPRRNRSHTAKAATRQTENRKLAEQFEKKRRYSWEKRESARLLASMEKGDKAAARRKLLATLAAPLTSLGGRIFWVKERGEPGPVGATEIDVNIVRYQIRAGFSTLLGIRTMPGPDDLVFLESLSVGAQWPSQFSPYVLLRGGVGIFLSNDGESTDSILIGSVGADVGLDIWINPWLVVTPSVGYMGTVLSGAYRNTFTAKIAIGF